MLEKYNQKRDFTKTLEPKATVSKSPRKIFVVQHHLATRDHYDFRLSYNGVLLSFAIPKGPSYNPNDKRLAVAVEDHPFSYCYFEGIIPKGQYGAGCVMLWDKGKYLEIEKFADTLKNGYLKFELFGQRLKGKWTLIKFKDDNWFLKKENDGINLFNDINIFKTSIKTGKTMEEIKDDIDIKLSSPDKVVFQKEKITKKDIMNYYQKIAKYMLPYLNERYLSVVRAPNGTDGEIFYKKHFPENSYLIKKNGFYYLNSISAILNEIQLNTIEFHIGAASAGDISHPNYMVFDLDPDEKLPIGKVRGAVKDLKQILDNLNLKAYLKTSGGKGYHVVVAFPEKITWRKFNNIAESITLLMVQKYPDKYTMNIRKKNREGKIFIDYLRNKKNATSVAPYSLRARKKARVSMPIAWNELNKVRPDSITIAEALKRIKRKNPWEDFPNL